MITYAEIKTEKQKDNSYKFYVRGEDTKISIVPVGSEGWWWIKFPEGDLSLDFYNLDRACDNTKSWLVSTMNEIAEDCPCVARTCR